MFLNKLRPGLRARSYNHPFIPNLRMLCAQCTYIFQKQPQHVEHSGPHHKSVEHVERAASSGCKICIWLEQVIHARPEIQLLPAREGPVLEYHMGFASELRFYARKEGPSSHSWFGKDFILNMLCSTTDDVRRPKGHDNFLDLVASDLPAEPWRVRDDGLPRLPVPPNTGDTATAETARIFLDSCLEHHQSCGHQYDPSFVPRRLIDAGDSEHDPRLVVTEYEPPVSRYATLSHCWGPSPSFHTLTADNLEEMKHKLPLEKLPKSFQDAILTARRMQIKYVWIDSLCIVQSGAGSHEDWLEHATSMAAIYQNGILNIAIDRASNPHQGAFTDRHIAQLQGSYFSFKGDSDGDPMWQVNGSDPQSSWAILHLPLAKRAWVLQERIFSPRVLHFGADRIYWECGEFGLVDESIQYGGSDDEAPILYDSLETWPFSLMPSSTKNSMLLTAVSSTRQRWHALLSRYTETSLTYPEKDKLVALAGIARSFASMLDSAYVAGCFVTNLPLDLLWACADSAPGRPSARSTYRAPTWSWASVDGFVYVQGLQVQLQTLAKVKEWHVDLLDVNNPFGGVIFASLTLQSILLPCKIHSTSRNETASKRNKIEILNDINATNSGEDLRNPSVTAEVIFDCLAASNFNHEIFALPIGETSRLRIGDGDDSIDNSIPLTMGLVLRRNNSQSYERIGMYCGSETFAQEIMDSRTCLPTDIVLV